MATDRDFQYDLRPSLQPLLWPACAFAIGIAAGDVAGVPAAHAVLGCGAAAAMGAAAARLGCPRLVFVTLLVAVGLAGSVRAAVSRSAMDSRPIRRHVDSGRIRPGDALRLVGAVEDVPERPPSSARLDIRVTRLRLADGDWIDIDGRATVGIRLSDDASALAFDALSLERGTPVDIMAEASDELAFRNPGVESLRSSVRRRGRDLAARASGPAAILVTGSSRDCPFLRRLAAVRLWGLAEIDAAFDPRPAGVLRALLLGDESRLDESTAESYRRSGAYHVLVISGAHVALLAGLSVWLAGRLSRSPVMRLIAGAVPAWLYALLLGGPAPVVRAALAVTVALLGPLAGRRAPPPNTLAAAALAVLVLDPAAIRDPSFQLTFAAVAAIVCIAAPLVARTAEIGRWRPNRGTPFPPVCSRTVRAVAETLYWDERRFRAERRAAVVRFGAAKHRVAVWMSLSRLQGIVRRVVVGLWIAIVVQVALAPLSVTSFGRLTLAGTVWALAVEALLGLALVTGIAFLASRAIAPAFAAPCAWVTDWFVALSNAAAADAAAGWPAPEPSGWSALLLWAGPVSVVSLAILLASWHPLPRLRGELVRSASHRRWRIAAVVTAVVLMALPSVPHETRRADGLLHVIFLDVGQGDAAFVRFPDGSTMLIDAGGRPRFDEPLGFDGGEPLRAERFDIGDRVVSASLLSQGFSRVDWFVATHGDVDHVGGFGAVMRRLSVGRVVIGAGADASERALAREAADRGKPVVMLGAGDALEIGGARLEVVWPTTDAPIGNDGSLVFRIVFGCRSLLFTGDIEEAGEGSLLRLAAARGFDLHADVLKVSHHGSRGASSDAFIGSIAPKWAVVSAPRQSPYGHPHAETVRRLRSGGAMVMQTGIDGAVGFITDGHEIALQRIAESGTQLLPPDFDHGARCDRTKSPGGPK